MKKILVATDFSAHAARATEYAAALARLFGAKLELITSAWLPPIVSAETAALNVGGGTLPAGLIDAARERANAQLEEVARPLRAEGLDVDCLVTMETPSAAICARAEETGVDLIALGTRGLSGLKHVVLGSIAERTARIATCPVLTAHEDSPPPGSLDKILVPTDFSETAERALEFAQSIAAKTGGTLLLQHACHVPVSIESDAWAIDSPAFQGLEEEARKRIAEVQQRIDGDTRALVSRGIPDVEIVDQARSHDASLIVIGTRGRTGLAHLILGSTAERVIRSATAPVISVGTGR
jgi:nucleotide-binding universal stress UspA family protein